MNGRPQEAQSTTSSDSINLKDLDVLDFPKWYSEDLEKGKFKDLLNRIQGKRSRYEDYLISQLRATYMDLEGDLRTLIPEYAGVTSAEERKNLNEIGKYIVHLLSAAKGILENQKLGKRRMLIASTILYEVEECLIWITPPPLALAQITALKSRIDQLKSSEKDKEKYGSMLDDCEKILDEKKENFEGISKSTTEYYRARLEEIVRFVNTETLRETINTGLQIERLRTLRYWGMVLLFSLIFIFPIISDQNKWISEGMNIITINALPFLSNGMLVALVVAVCLSIIGGLGGFLSGLLQVRASKTDLGDFEMRVLLFHLRPILGAIAALILAALMSRGVLDDVINGNGFGSYIMVAFVSGFSERYFIKLLKLNTEEYASEAQLIPAQEEEQSKNGNGTKPKSDVE
mgnify:CR=1 FL=1